MFVIRLFGHELFAVELRNRREAVEEDDDTYEIMVGGPGGQAEFGFVTGCEEGNVIASAHA